MAKMLSNEDLEYISSYTAISKDEVKEQFENFLKENPKGKMTKNHFKHFWKKCFPDVDCGELIEHVFRMCDMDNNAKIGKKTNKCRFEDIKTIIESDFYYLILLALFGRTGSKMRV